MFQLEHLHRRSEDTGYGSQKVWYVDDIRVATDFDAELLSEKELHERFDAAGQALDRLTELRERNEPDRSRWPVWVYTAITFLFAANNTFGPLSESFFYAWLLVGGVVIAYPLLKLFLMLRFHTAASELNTVMTDCFFELSDDFSKDS